MRIPENRVQEVESLLAGAHAESVTESVESVTESKILDDLMALKERWREKLSPHQDPSGQVKQPRWAKCWELWQELAQILNHSHQG